MTGERGIGGALAQAEVRREDERRLAIQINKVQGTCKVQGARA